MNSDISLGPVALDEDVGHDVARTSEDKARRPEAIEQSMRKNVRDGRELSVNRVSEAERRGEIADLVSIILTRGTAGTRRFQGWGMLAVQEITNEGFEVCADPAPPINQMPENPYHALIFLPETSIEDRDERYQHIRYLSEVAAENWKSRPEI